jgi:hypothetical protein
MPVVDTMLLPPDEPFARQLHHTSQTSLDAVLEDAHGQLLSDES